MVWNYNSNACFGANFVFPLRENEIDVHQAPSIECSVSRATSVNFITSMNMSCGQLDAAPMCIVPDDISKVCMGRYYSLRAS